MKNRMSSTAQSEPFKVVYFGTPEFCVPCLDYLLSLDGCNVCAVVTQPDKPAGRGQQFAAPPVKTLALQHSIPVFQPASLKNIELTQQSGVKHLTGEKSSETLAEFLNEAAPVDLFATCAYGKIIPASLVHFPRLGMINVHPSLLPRWRGAAPLQRALFAGDEKTGVSIMQVDEGLDTGPVYCSRELQMEPNETLGTLHDKLARIGAELLIQCIPDILSGALKPVPQSEEGASYAEKWENDDLEINWSDPAAVTLRRIRACSPIPGARTLHAGTQVKIHSAHQTADQNFAAYGPGTVVEVNKAELIVACGSGEYIAIDEMQFPGKSRLVITELLRGRNFKAGERFGE
jgi:methionyl-tRNA formyltransferase